MSARDEATEMIRRICPPHLSADKYGDVLSEKFDAHRAEVLADVSAWLVKKAREFRAAGQTTQADTASRLSSKVDRGAIRPNNLRMLPADFFEPGRTYTHVDDRTDWMFRVDTVTTHPEDGERTALGWRHFRGQWDPYAYGEDDFDVQQHVGLHDVTSAGEDDSR